MHLSENGRQRPSVEQRSFISFDGTPIGYQVCGNPQGVPLLLANGVGATVTAYRFIIHRFAHVFRFYSWDYRGMYTSGRPLGGYDAMTIEHHARDGIALMAHAEMGRAFAMGWSMGVQVLLEMMRTVEDQIEGLVLHNGVAGAVYRNLEGTPALAHLIPRTIRGLQRVDHWVSRFVQWAVESPLLIPVGCRVGLVHPGLDHGVFQDIAKNFKDLDMHLYLEALQRLGEHDASDILTSLSVPTLLLASTHDQMTPLSAAERMHERIADCELRVIPNGTHYAAVEFPELINRYLEDWFTRRFPLLSIASATAG